ncbi:MAG: 1-acyl-sn-glycerol-3-phosphate acyltransferase, partial [Planctomycetes bacterium]|nr:1-acyl-sn-glycerol-3-phosphate acyltransferase [Planctomycetota bacterium]
RMEHGFLVGLFPEGTRSETGEVGPFKPGFVALVRRSKLPIYPVGIAGGFQALGKGSWFLKPTRVRLVFGPPITLEDLARFDSREKDEELIEFVRSRVIDCYQKAESWRIERIDPQA